jgi:hypothetical protein
MASILKVDTIQDQSGNNIINENANTITIGASGDTISIPAGATLSNLGTANNNFNGDRRIMIIEAIFKINPNAKVVVKGNDINTCEIEWHNGTTPISKADIEAKMVELQAEYEANQYQRDRAVAYPSIQEQLDMQYWDKINGTNNWQDAINAVKAKYPKE